MGATHSVSDEEEYLTDREVAAMLKLSRHKLQNWRWQGIGIPYVKLGDGKKSPVRYRRSAVVAWLNAHSQNPSVSEAMAKR